VFIGYFKKLINPYILYILISIKDIQSLQPSAFSLQPSAFSLQPSAFSLQPSGEGLS
jgi:hypothetical protein